MNFQNIRSCRSRYANDHSDDNGDKQMMKEDVKRLREKVLILWAVHRSPISYNQRILSGCLGRCIAILCEDFFAIMVRLGFSRILDSFRWILGDSLGFFQDSRPIIERFSEILGDSLRFFEILGDFSRFVEFSRFLCGFSRILDNIQWILGDSLGFFKNSRPFLKGFFEILWNSWGFFEI